MKDKNVAGILALLFGSFGIHRFYLGQPVRGIFYMLFFWTGIPALIGFIEAIIFFVMDKEVFDVKYNRQRMNVERRFRNEGYESERERYREHRREKRRERRTPRYNPRPQRKATGSTPPRTRKKTNPYKLTGIKKFKDYDFDGAIEEFKKALGVDAKDAAVHFNIACAYSMEEQVDEAFFHLSKAVENGFVDFDRIQNHDSLAYIRAMDLFPEFVKNGYKIPVKESRKQTPKEEIKKEIKKDTPPIKEELKELPPPQENLLDEIPADLLEQFEKLEQLKNKGFLTEKQFELQKKKLLG